MINIDLLIGNSMKSQNKTELRAYKNLKAEIQKFQTAKNAKPYDNVAEIGILSKYVKSLEDSISSFSKAHREDLVAEYNDELEVLKKLLPAPVNEREIYSFIRNDEDFFDKFWVVKDLEKEQEGTYMKIEIPKKEMGNAIKYLKSKFPQAEGKMISDIVKNFIV